MHRKAQLTGGRLPERQVEQPDARRSRPRGAPHSGGVPNEVGYHEDQPRDTASAECCALLRPFPHTANPASSASSTLGTRRGRFGNG
jgi:hypothetical protein